ncbi:hypothetical protein E2P81_ATG04030 [Venturia nashicola]|nr:hypothetical protein E2P81_ATG04030 [Venturia nashicola]
MLEVGLDSSETYKAMLEISNFGTALAWTVHTTIRATRKGSRKMLESIGPICEWELVILTIHSTLSEELDLIDENSVEKLLDQVSAITFKIKHFFGVENAGLFGKSTCRPNFEVCWNRERDQEIRPLAKGPLETSDHETKRALTSSEVRLCHLHP